MIKKLRYKFIAVTMTGIGLLLLLMLLVINIFMTFSNNRRGYEILERVEKATDRGVVPLNDQGIEPPEKEPAPKETFEMEPSPKDSPEIEPPAKEAFEMKPFKDDYLDFLRVFSITYDENMEVMGVDFNEKAGITQEDIITLGEKALAKIEKEGAGNENERGMIGYRYLYLMSRKEGSRQIFFLDYSVEHSMNFRLFYLCLCIGLAGMLILFVLVWFLSAWIVRPVETAFEKQKNFIADASHELKTPLTIIGANAEILSGELGGSKWVENILEQTWRMNHLVKDFLNLARLDSCQKSQDFQEFDLSRSISASALSFESLAYESHISYKMEIDGELFYKGSEPQIRQLVTILLDNAFKYTAEGGSVAITLTGKGEKRTMTVYNTGKGISPEDQKHIFERFYRSDSSRSRETGGYGLGLAIAASIVENHGGQIKVKSDAESYTQIVVVL